MEYSWPSSVNVANFVTVRPDLKNEEERSMNFNMWKEQMMCLVESQGVAGFINGEIVEPQTDEQKLWRRSDKLVKGWILGSIGTDVLHKVCKLQTAREVWLKLEKIFNDDEETDSDSTTDQSDQGGEGPYRGFTQYLPLYNAAIRGDWETANTLFFHNNIWETEARISLQQETALHVAVQSGRANDFVRNLVGLMSYQALSLRDCFGYTALHCAAVVGNTEAARAMLQKYPYMLYMLELKNISPVSLAAICRQKNTLTYLISVYESNAEHYPFEGLPIDTFLEIVGSEFFDVALDMVYKYPHLARSRHSVNGKCALSIMAGMDMVFLYRESLSWWEKLIFMDVKGVPLKQHVSRLTFVPGDNDVPAYKKLSTWFQIINGGK